MTHVMSRNSRDAYFYVPNNREPFTVVTRMETMSIIALEPGKTPTLRLKNGLDRVQTR